MRRSTRKVPVGFYNHQRKRGRGNSASPSAFLDFRRFLSAEVSLQQAGEGLAVSGLVPGHLVDGVVDGVQVQGLGALGKVGLQIYIRKSGSIDTAGFSLHQV